MIHGNNALAIQPLYPLQPQAFSESLFNRFIDYTDRKETTTKGYLTCIRQFIKWLAENNITQPVREDIKDYRAYLQSREDLQPSTQQQYLRAVKHTSGTGAYKATGNIYLAQKHQRHASPETTEIYVHAEERNERQTEQQVYDYYFGAADKDKAAEAAQLLQALDAAKLDKVIDFIKMIK